MGLYHILGPHRSHQPVLLHGIHHRDFLDVGATEELHHHGEIVLFVDRRTLGIDQITGDDQVLQGLALVDQATHLAQRDGAEQLALVVHDEELRVAALDDQVEDRLEIRRSGGSPRVAIQHVAHEEPLEGVGILFLVEIDPLAPQLRGVDRVLAEQLAEQGAEDARDHQGRDDVDRLGELEDDDDRADGSMGGGRHHSAHRDQRIGGPR